MLFLYLFTCGASASSYSSPSGSASESETAPAIKSAKTIDFLDNSTINKIYKTHKIAVGSPVVLTTSGEIASVESLAGAMVTKLTGEDYENNSFKYFNNTDAEVDIVRVTLLDGSVQNHEIRIKRNVENALFLYLAGDNNLNGGDEGYDSRYDFVKQDLEDEIVKRMKDITNTVVYVLLDTNVISYGQSAIFNEPGVYRINNEGVRRVKNIKEPNTGDPNTLLDFLLLVQDLSNSSFTCLDLWAHGFSVLGVGFDDNSNHDSLTPLELLDIFSDNRVKKIDVLNFSACLLMDLGVLGLLPPNKILAAVGSPESVPGDGSFYGNETKSGILGAIAKGNDVGALDTAKEIARINFNSYFNGGHDSNSFANDYLIYSAVDMSKIAAVEIALKTFLQDRTSLNLTRKTAYSEGALIDMASIPASYPDDEDAIAIKDALSEAIIYTRTIFSTPVSPLGISLINNYAAHPDVANNIVYKNTGWIDIIR